MKITKTLTLRLLLFTLTSSVLLSCEKETSDDADSVVEANSFIEIDDLSTPLSYHPDFRYFKDGNEITDKEEIDFNYTTTTAVNTNLEDKIVTFLDEEEIGTTQARFSYKNIIIIMRGKSKHHAGQTGTHYTYHTNSSRRHSMGSWITHTKRPQWQENMNHYVSHFLGSRLNQITVMNTQDAPITFGMKHSNGIWFYWDINPRRHRRFSIQPDSWIEHKHTIKY